MAAGWLGGAGVSTMEPARLLLAAGVCRGRNPRSCHAWGASASRCWAAWPPAPALRHGTVMQLRVADRSRTTGANWFAVGLQIAGTGVDARSSCLSFHPFLKGVFHEEVPLPILDIQMVPLGMMLLLTPPFGPEISIYVLVLFLAWAYKTVLKN